jgi:TusA-related sulfurtransferase
MLREALVVDGTAKTCRGVVAGLERGITELSPGDLVIAVVEDIPTRLEVYAWALRKHHRVVEERRQGVGYVLYIAKGSGAVPARRAEGGPIAGPASGRTDPPTPPPEAHA